MRGSVHSRISHKNVKPRKGQDRHPPAAKSLGEVRWRRAREPKAHVARPLPCKGSMPVVLTFELMQLSASLDPILRLLPVILRSILRLVVNVVLIFKRCTTMSRLVTGTHHAIVFTGDPGGCSMSLAHEAFGTVDGIECARTNIIVSFPKVMDTEIVAHSCHVSEKIQA